MCEGLRWEEGGPAHRHQEAESVSKAASVRCRVAGDEARDVGKVQTPEGNECGQMFGC